MKGKTVATEDQMAEAMAGMKATLFALKLQNAIEARLDENATDEQKEEAFGEILQETVEKIKGQFKLTASNDDFATNYALWKKAVGEEIANDLKDNPAITEIVAKWVGEAKEHNTTLMANTLIGLLTEEDQAEVEQIDAFCFMAEYMGM